jgi:thiol-disulfide isomerase/thioredoxin
MDMPRVLPVLAFLIMVSAPSVTYSSNLKEVIREFQMVELHQSAPNFTFTDAQGRKVDLSSYRGKAVLLHFWASWCTPCQKELPDLVQLSKLLDSKRWVFLPISVDEPDQRSKAAKFLEGLKGPVPFYRSNDPKAVDKYKTWGLPVTYLISPSGEIVARALGRKNWMPGQDAAHDLNDLFHSP